MKVGGGEVNGWQKACKYVRWRMDMIESESVYESSLAAVP